ncbi:MAG: hypothetical protein U5L07_03195, partial [Desulfobacterales bacterium]|nr:hypothetical protein [Desulfobacterales bacterium]
INGCHDVNDHQRKQQTGDDIMNPDPSGRKPFLNGRRTGWHIRFPQASALHQATRRIFQHFLAGISFGSTGCVCLCFIQGLISFTISVILLCDFQSGLL